MSTASQNAHYLEQLRLDKEELERRQQCFDNYERLGKFVDNEGYDLDGFNEHGVNRFGHGRYGVGPDGEFRDFYEQAFRHERLQQDARIDHYQFVLDNLGKDDSFDADGFNYLNFDRDGFDRDGYDLFGYDRKGYDRDGYDRDGYNRKGYDRDGYNRKGKYNAKFDRSI